jgi:hypothetical protein|tara:strand:+ start:121 stop:960 length:840 start_codon:yes stop_codon:yes gene_type:complete
MAFISRFIKPRDIYKYFRYQTELSRPSLKKVQKDLTNLSDEEFKKLQTKDLKDLTADEEALIMHGMVTMSAFGRQFKNKRLVDMSTTEFNKFKKVIASNRTNQFVKEGDTVRKTTKILPESKMMPDYEWVPTGVGDEGLWVQSGKSRVSNIPEQETNYYKNIDGDLVFYKDTITPDINKLDAAEEFYQPTFLFDKAGISKKTTGASIIVSKAKARLKELNKLKEEYDLPEFLSDSKKSELADLENKIFEMKTRIERYGREGYAFGGQINNQMNMLLGER